jgi:hypothetical protein
MHMSPNGMMWHTFSEVPASTRLPLRVMSRLYTDCFGPSSVTTAAHAQHKVRVCAITHKNVLAFRSANNIYVCVHSKNYRLKTNKKKRGGLCSQ